MLVTLASQYISCICLIPDLYAKIYILGFHCAVNVPGQAPIGCLQYISNDGVCARCTDKGLWWGHVEGKQFCATVHAKLFWRAIYCAKLRPDPKYQSSYQYRRLPGRQVPQIMREYNLVTTIVIQPLAYPRTCEMGYLIFSAMSQLKFVSSTRASFPSMPSTERTNGEKQLYCLCQCLP